MKRPFKSLKVIKKTRTIKPCRGCGKDIPTGSSCISLFEFLGVRYANDYFHDVECVKIAIREWFKNVEYLNKWMDEMIQTTSKT